MKGTIEIEFEYESYDHLVRALNILTKHVSDVRPYAEIKRVTATSYDSDDKPFMTTERNG